MSTILFVEDEESLQKTLGGALKEHGYEVTPAYTGNEALSYLEGHKPDLILLDLILPEKDGFEVLEELKNNEETKNIPVIVLTQLEDAEDVQRAISLGAKTYLVKINYSLDDVVEKVENALT